MQTEIDKIQTLLASAEKARREKRFEDAKRDVVSALAISRLIQQVDFRVQSLNDLARIERDLGNTITAIAGYMKLVKLYQKNSNQAGIAHSYRHLADIYLEANHLEKADVYYRKAIEIYKNKAHQSSLDLANASRGLALLKVRQEKIQEALNIWEHARKLYATNKINKGVKECDRWIARLQ